MRVYPHRSCFRVLLGPGILLRSSHADRRFAIPQGRPVVSPVPSALFQLPDFSQTPLHRRFGAFTAAMPRPLISATYTPMGRMQFECSNGRHGRLGRLERLVRITQAAASLPPSRSCRPITLLLRGDTRQFQICSRRPRIPKDAGRSARSHARPKSVRLADHHIVHKVSTRQLVEFSHGTPYQACSPPCSLRSYPSDCECLLNERGEYPVKTFGASGQRVQKLSRPMALQYPLHLRTASMAPIYYLVLI